MVPLCRLMLAVALLFVYSCGTARGPEAIAEAFAGPASLNLREDIALRSKVVATVKHGEHLDVLQTRRRFVQVRTRQGAVGWTDSRQLMSPAEMRDLRTLTEASKALPSQGTATVFELLNVHTEPVRSSPSFAQIPESSKVEVIGHKVMPRTVAARAPSLVIPKKVAKTLPKKKKESESRRVPPPPMPPAPKPPANWLELSRAEPAEDGTLPRTGEDTPESEEKPVPMEDWSLIRMADGRVGWVLLRMLTLSIPDEVAQYAEGHRITSYFALSDIQDDSVLKHAWLWTTNSQRGQPFEFDGLRVFTWNVRRHRYETVYRERQLIGYYPVQASRTPGGATFSVVVRTGDGVVRKTYAFNGYRVNLVNQEPYTRQEIGVPAAEGKEQTQFTKTPARSESWFTKLPARLRGLFR